MGKANPWQSKVAARTISGTMLSVEMSPVTAHSSFQERTGAGLAAEKQDKSKGRNANHSLERKRGLKAFTEQLLSENVQVCVHTHHLAGCGSESPPASLTFPPSPARR